MPPPQQTGEAMMDEAPAPAPKATRKKMEGSGRKPGSRNKLTIERAAARDEVISKAMAEGTTPLAVMMTVMLGGKAAKGISERQYLAAKDAAPYVHARMAAIQHSGKIGIEPSEMTDAELAALAAGCGEGTAEA